jgi:Rad3-related DNA helicase
MIDDLALTIGLMSQ